VHTVQPSDVNEARSGRGLGQEHETELRPTLTRPRPSYKVNRWTV